MHMSKILSNTRVQAVLAIIAAMVSVQAGAALAKHLFQSLSPQGITSFRLLFAFIILFITWRPWRNWPARKEWKSIIFYGISLGCMNLLFYLAIARIPLGIAVALEFTGPLAIALLASKRPRDFIWVITAVPGILLLLPITSFNERLDPLGILYAFCAALCWALYIVFGKKTSKAVHSGTAVTLGMCVGSMVTFPIGVIQAGSAIFAPAILPLVFLVAVLASSIPCSLEMIALGNLPAHTFSILMSLEPAIATLSGALFLNEHLTFLQCFAIALIILSSIGSTWFTDMAQTTPEIAP